MANVTDRPEHDVLDVIGVGFGPSNLGLAIALEEHNATAAAEDRITARFVERQEQFGWHRGMLLEDATMQVSFLKDLVTIRNPNSAFTFLSYLKERERLVDFINYGSNFPTRLEFHDYLEWAASRFTDTVDYGAEVDEIVPVRGADGAVEQVEVVYRRGGETVRQRARNVVLATGLSPALPRGISAGARIWHNKDLLHRAPHLVDGADSRSADASLGADARSADASLGTPKRMAVIGAGQSAAETVEYLHRTFPGAEVYAVFARYGYSPADDSSFANRIFDPGAVDDFYTAPDGVKEMIMGYHGNTNYSVVDPELIDGLYRTHYHERVAGKERLKFCNVSRVADVVEVDDRVELAVESLIDGEREVITADVVVYATGYRAGDPLWLLGGGLPEACGRDVAGRLDVRRDYRVGTEALADGTPVVAGIYLQGPTEHTHGISSTLLSNVAVRSGEIAGSIVTGGASASGRPAGAPAAATVPGVARTGG